MLSLSVEELASLRLRRQSTGLTFSSFPGFHIKPPVKTGGFLMESRRRASATSVGAAGIAGASTRCLLRLRNSPRFRLRRMPHWGTSRIVPRSLNLRDSTLWRSLVSADLTADETPATGSRRRFARNLNGRNSPPESKESHTHREVVFTTLAHRARKRSFSNDLSSDEISRTAGRQSFARIPIEPPANASGSIM